MANLSSISPIDPADAEDVALGASRIRAIADALLTSFALEHSLDGAHKIPSGQQSAKPVAGHAGRLFIDILNQRMELDDGVTWTGLHFVQARGHFDQPALSITGTNYITVASVAVNVPLAGRGLAIASLNITGSGIYKFLFGSVDSQVPLPDQAFGQVNGPTLDISVPMILIGFSAAVTSGDQTISLQMKKASAGSPNPSVDARAIVSLIF